MFRAYTTCSGLKISRVKLVKVIVRINVRTIVADKHVASLFILLHFDFYTSSADLHLTNFNAKVP